MKKQNISKDKFINEMFNLCNKELKNKYLFKDFENRKVNISIEVQNNTKVVIIKYMPPRGMLAGEFTFKALYNNYPIKLFDVKLYR